MAWEKYVENVVRLCHCGVRFTTDPYCPHVLHEKKFAEINRKINKEVWDKILDKDSVDKIGVLK